MASPSQLHLLGRAAAQIVVHFGRYGYTPRITLYQGKQGPPALLVVVPGSPSEPQLLAFYSFPWLKYFHTDRLDDVPDSYAFILYPNEHIPT